MHKFAMLAALALGACVANPEPDGKRSFMEKCAVCHGIDAMGTGEMSRHLIKMAPDLTTLSAQNGGVFPRNDVMATIDGLNRVSHFSGAMPEFGAGDLGEVIIVEQDGLGTPVPAELLALAEYLEDIQR